MKTQRTLLLSLLILLGITTLWRALRDGEEATLHGDRRFWWLGVAAVPAYLAAMYWPFSAGFFQLAPLDAAQWTLVIGFAAAAYGLSVLSDRLRW